MPNKHGYKPKTNAMDGQRFSNSNKQFLKFHILIESIRRKNINLVNYLQTTSNETQHFQELKKKIKNEIAQQTNKISILQNNLSETKDTFEFCFGKFKNSSYLNYQKSYEMSLEFFYQRKKSRKKKFGKENRIDSN